MSKKSTSYKCGYCKGTGTVTDRGGSRPCRVCNGSGEIIVEWKEPDGR